MRFGTTLGTRRIVKAYPGLAGASVGSIFIESSKLLIKGKLFEQLRQQRALDRRLQSSLESLDFGKRGAIVQVGANDGQHSDPIRDILAARDIRAVLVEPMPIAFQALSQLYTGKSNVQLVNAAISATGEKLVLYVPEIEGSELQSTLWACRSQEQALHEVQRIMGWNALEKTKIVKHPIKSQTAAQLLKSTGVSPKEVKVVVCDTEGQDADIIGSFLDAGVRPEVIFYEKLHVAPSRTLQLNAKLKRLGYSLDESNKDVYARKQRA
jgi:FkbM family methyltransferase